MHDPNAASAAPLPESAATDLPVPPAEAEPAPPTADEPPTSRAPLEVDTAPAVTVPLDALRALVVRAYPDAPAELVAGDSLEALLASAERARELRARLLAEAQAAHPPVSAGAPRGTSEAEAARLSPFEKIARAIAGRGS